MDMNNYYYKLLSTEERRRVEDLELFDEYEEWHLKCAHYFVLCASQGSVKPPLDDSTTIPGNKYNIENEWVVSHIFLIQFFNLMLYNH